MEKRKSSLAELKKNYKGLQAKYKLPKFSFMNENFEIEKLAEQETDFLLREIRKLISEKAVAYLRFVEMLLNPSNAPFFFFGLVKNFSSADRKIVEKIYEKLIEFEIDAMSIDNEYSEKREAEFIRKTVEKWQDVKQDMKELIDAIKKSWQAKKEKSEKSYFG